MAATIVPPRLAAALWLGLWLAGGAGAQPRAPGSAPSGPGPAAPAPLRITTARVTGRTVERSVDTVGRLAAWEDAVARAPVAGTVVRLHADRGAAVRQGEPLAELDRRDTDLELGQLAANLTAARESLAQARAAAEASRASLARVRDGRRALATEVERTRADAEMRRRELDRAQALRAQDLIATRDVDQARARWEAADALARAAEAALGQHGEALRAAEVQLQADVDAVTAGEVLARQREAAVTLGQTRLTDAVTVVSPLTGVVATRDVAAGALVEENAPLFTVVATDPLKYAGTAPARAAAELRPGQAVHLVIDAVGVRVFPAEVTHVAPAVDPARPTLALEARILNGEGLLRPGLAARGTVVLRRDTGVPFVPEAAVAQVAGASTVFVVTGGRAEARPVTTGPREGRWVEILDGVQPGETVATSGLAQLVNGARVIPMAPGPAATP